MRVFIYLLGFGFSVIGGVTSIAYLNLITPERGWINYFQFISTRMECYLLPIGMIVMWFSLYFPDQE
ncbi:hypothetical protein PNH38_15445 [Anoxybacillus rupiensis]|jgi:hypothetical protein|uniref:Uncharacterized protein n=1 Tax=Anoxybacteroides rupiense TaxID=311460 RepID=A0ABD5IV82_9BACL|nr:MULTISPECIES: hypothetical protein [Anoxybacillus]KXG10167.1 hypothetical protein AT864_01728 [Anoxybacillus sp. P3H1B]MBB3907485.1 hypothetical protein [Anoxybacillus rupiensis]MBS2770488.1 hypothetical protein [Anoxybacillus rupiensis]MDE8565252.1 hypothetical protein [Anoxybacillus rupiensis]MED5051866.1 hypothetical protein [Anoxybacillus rupiensis]